VEDLDTCSTACDAAESNQTEGVELLMKITQDRVNSQSDETAMMGDTKPNCL
jgi:hypothetical protein